MLTGLDDYLEGGGRLVYLGGNGLYWVTVCPPGRTDIVEIRRGFSGTRSGNRPLGRSTTPSQVNEAEYGGNEAGHHNGSPVSA